MTSRMNKKIAQFFIVYRLPILSGFLIGTSYIPFYPWALFFCLVPLFLFWRSAATAKQAFIGAWITQFILNLIGFHWIAHTAIEFGHFPVWAGYLALLGFAALAHLHYPISGLLTVWFSRKLNLRPILFFPLAVLIFAVIEAGYPMVFKWHLGYPWIWAGWPGYQTADLIGFEGLNIITIAINALIASGFWQMARVRKHLGETTAAETPACVRRFSFHIAAAIAILLVVNVLGLGRADEWSKTDAQFSVLAVQGNIGNFDKLLAEKGKNFREPIITKYIEITRAGLTKAAAANTKPDLIIWPETAFPDLLDVPYQNDPNVGALRNLVATTQTPLLTGSYSYDAATKDTYNGFFFMNPNGVTPYNPHRKSILLVFGETFPFADTIPYMDKLFPDLGSFGKGEGPKVMTIQVANRDVKLGPQICYEGLYPWFTSSLSEQGAEVFSNVTNDSWFGDNFEPKQHLYMTLARAIEFRRPLLRSTNTGITTVILADGEILEKSPIGEEWSGTFQIRYKTDPPHTFYEKIAGKIGWTLFAILVLVLIFGRYARRVE